MELGRLETGCDADRERHAACVDGFYRGINSVLEIVGVQLPAALPEAGRTGRDAVQQWVEECKAAAVTFTRVAHMEDEGASQYIEAVAFELQNFTRKVFGMMESSRLAGRRLTFAKTRP